MTATARPVRIGHWSSPIQDHGDDGDNRSAHGNTPMAAAAIVAVLSPLFLVGAVALIGYLFRN